MAVTGDSQVAFCIIPEQDSPEIRFFLKVPAINAFYLLAVCEVEAIRPVFNLLCGSVKRKELFTLRHAGFLPCIF